MNHSHRSDSQVHQLLIDIAASMKIITALLATASLLGLSSYGIFANAQDLLFPQLTSLDDVSFDAEGKFYPPPI